MNESGNLSGEMESAIINAATTVFVKKGRVGSSMQDIADEAGINRTLLNYYFRSKDKLFGHVFHLVLNDLIVKAVEILNSDKDILLKINEFIEMYIRHLLEHPRIPIFVMNELSSNTEYLVTMVKSKIKGPLPIIKEIEKAMDDGRIYRMDAIQLVVSLISAIVFPFATKSILDGLLLKDAGLNFNDMMEERISFLKGYFTKMIIIEK